MITAPLDFKKNYKLSGLFKHITNATWSPSFNQIGMSVPSQCSMHAILCSEEQTTNSANPKGPILSRQDCSG